MEQTQVKEKTKMMAIPESVHTRLAALKQPHEPFYSVLTRLMDNMDKIEQKPLHTQFDKDELL